jgi:hypothetical protein
MTSFSMKIFINKISVLFQIFIFILFQFSFMNCKKDDNILLTSKVQTNIVLTSVNHLAFPDLLFYKNIWFLTYRESDAHAKGTFSKIKVYKSNDFKVWTEINSYELTEFDLRDPKFSYDEVSDNIYLHIPATNTSGVYGVIRKNFIVGFNKQNLQFLSDSLQHTINLLAKFPNDWLWRPVWHEGILFAGGYKQGNLRFYKYENYNKPPLVFSYLEGNGTSEATFKFYGDKIFSIVRRGVDAYFGTGLLTDVMNFDSLSPNVHFEWISLPFPQLGGPNMVIYADKALIGGRTPDSKTAIINYSISNNAIENIEELYSFGDNSYPGMVLYSGYIYGVYYTQTEDLKTFQIRSFIYPITNL